MVDNVDWECFLYSTVCLIIQCQLFMYQCVSVSAHLLISQSRNQMSAQADSELLNALNTIRQRMEEVMDIVSSLKPVLQVSN